MVLSNDFYEKILLLVATATLSGLLIPLVLFFITEVRNRSKKKLEEDLQKQTEKFKEQAALIDDLTTTLWTWRYLAKRVVYYPEISRTKYFEACEEYELKVWDLLTRFRIQSSRARRLLSEGAYAELKEFYKFIVEDVDYKIMELIQKPGAAKAFKKNSSELCDRFSNEVSPRIDEMMIKVYNDLQSKDKKD